MCKKSKILSAVCTLGLLGVGASGCTPLEYDNADAYSFGDVVLYENVLKLDVEWVSGHVTIASTDEGFVTVEEGAKRSLTDDQKLRYWLDGDTLRVRYAKAKNWASNSLPEKDLFITLPDNVTLLEAEVESVAAGVTISDLSVKELDVKTVSGNIAAALTGVTSDLEAESVSGNVDVTAAMQSFDVTTVSGNVRLYAVEDISVLKSGDLESVSGNVELYLPDGVQFSMGVSTVSGKFTSEFETTKQGDDYVCGTGDKRFAAKTVSGDIAVKKDPSRF